MSIPNALAELMTAAWWKLHPRLLQDSDEVRRRLARRRSAGLSRPWRAYCLSVKANDLRIHPYRCIVTPEHALNDKDSRHIGYLTEHDVLLDSQLLRFLCHPVQAICGEPLYRVARKLGCTASTLRLSLARLGGFALRRIPRLGGRPGPPVPVMGQTMFLDPGSARFYEMPDRVFGTHNCYLSERTPDGIAQHVHRVPLYGPVAAGPSYGFQGWRWACPACKALVKSIHYPLPPPMLDFLSTLPNVKTLDCDDRERGLPAFACHRCHLIQHPCFTSPKTWNRLISTFSGGLLTGKEVPRPDWFPVRAVPKVVQRHRRKRAPRSLHRATILELLLETDDNYPQIARKVLLTTPAVWRHAQNLYKEHNVSTREQLRAALNPTRESGAA